MDKINKTIYGNHGRRRITASFNIYRLMLLKDFLNALIKHHNNPMMYHTGRVIICILQVESSTKGPLSSLLLIHSQSFTPNFGGYTLISI